MSGRAVSSPVMRRAGFSQQIRRALAGGSLVAVTLVILSATGASAFTPTFKTTPYRNTTIQVYNAVNSFGCGKAKNIVDARWSAKTGAGAFADVARSPNCKLPFGTAAYAQGEFNLFVPFPYSGKTSPRNIWVNWTYNYTGTEWMVPGRCLPSSGATYWSCSESVYFNLIAYAYLIDLTSSYGTYLYAYPSNNWAGAYNNSYNYTSCSTSSCSYNSGGGNASVSSSVNFTWMISSTLNSTHHYYIQTYVAGYVNLYTSTSQAYIAGASYYAALNVASLGNGARLNYIEVL